MLQNGLLQKLDVTETWDISGEGEEFDLIQIELCHRHDRESYQGANGDAIDTNAQKKNRKKTSSRVY